MSRLAKFGVGGIFFLLPLFFLLPPIARTIEQQLIVSKFMLCFFLGGIFLSALTFKMGHAYLAIVNGLIVTNVLATGFGPGQLYVYAYWVAALSAALFFVQMDEDTQELCFRAVVYAAVISSVLGFFQALDMDPIMSYAPNITRADRMLPIGMMGQATKHGAFLAIALGMSLGLKEYVAAAFITVAVILTGSSFTALAAIGAVLVWMQYLPGGKNAVKGVCILGLIGGVGLFLSGSSLTMDHGRFAVWAATLRAWWDGPRIFGFGLGSFQAPVGPNETLFAKFFQPQELKKYGDFLQAHNDYVQAVFEMGLLGIAGIALGLKVLGLHYVRDWWKRRYPKNKVTLAAQAGLAAIVLNAIGNFPFQLAPPYLLAVIFVGILLDDGRREYNKA